VDARNDVQNRYTGLILLSGVDTPGISSALFSALEPFKITILDIEQVVIRSRLILTVLIELDPAHAAAVESDLNECAKNLNVDIATSFSNESMQSIAQKNQINTCNRPRSENYARSHSRTSYRYCVNWWKHRTYSPKCLISSYSH
jgi:phosphoserine phosphatase